MKRTWYQDFFEDVVSGEATNEDILKYLRDSDEAHRMEFKAIALILKRLTEKHDPSMGGYAAPRGF